MGAKRPLRLVVNISLYFLFILYTMHLKRRNSWPPDVSALDALAETQLVALSELYRK